MSIIFDKMYKGKTWHIVYLFVLCLSIPSHLMGINIGISINSLSIGLNLVRYKKLSPYPRPTLFTTHLIYIDYYKDRDPIRPQPNLAISINYYTLSNIMTLKDYLIINGGALFITPFIGLKYSQKTFVYYLAGPEVSHGYISFSGTNSTVTYRLDGLGLKFLVIYVIKISSNIGFYFNLNGGRYVLGAITENYRSYISLGMGINLIIHEFHYTHRVWF